MLDELTVLQPVQKPRMVTVHPTLVESLPFVESHISFGPLLHYLKEQYPSLDGTKERLYNYLIEKLEAEPQLLGPIDNIGIVEHHADLMELLTTTLFPIISSDQNNFSLPVQK